MVRISPWPGPELDSLKFFLTESSSSNQILKPGRIRSMVLSMGVQGSGERHGILKLLRRPFPLLVPAGDGPPKD
jgi:hypothetical protein